MDVHRRSAIKQSFLLAGGVVLMPRYIREAAADKLPDPPVTALDTSTTFSAIVGMPWGRQRAWVGLVLPSLPDGAGS